MWPENTTGKTNNINIQIKTDTSRIVIRRIFRTVMHKYFIHTCIKQCTRQQKMIKYTESIHTKLICIVNGAVIMLISRYYTDISTEFIEYSCVCPVSAKVDIKIASNDKVTITMIDHNIFNL